MRIKRLLQKWCGVNTTNVSMFEVRRGSKYIIIMEVPSDISDTERKVIMSAVDMMQKTLNEWIENSAETFASIVTVNSMPIVVKLVEDGQFEDED